MIARRRFSFCVIPVGVAAAYDGTVQTERVALVRQVQPADELGGRDGVVIEEEDGVVFATARGKEAACSSKLFVLIEVCQVDASGEFTVCILPSMIDKDVVDLLVRLDSFDECLHVVGPIKI